MKKTNEPKEPKMRKDMNPKEFMKIVINNGIVNVILVGLVLGMIQAFAQEYLKGIVLLIINLVITYFAITKIYVNAVKEAFNEARIFKKDINEIVQKITKTLCIVLLIILAFNLYTFITEYQRIPSYEVRNLSIIVLLVQIVLTIVLYGIIIVSCRKKFFEECNKPENVVE